MKTLPSKSSRLGFLSKSKYSKKKKSSLGHQSVRNVCSFKWGIHEVGIHFTTNEFSIFQMTYYLHLSPPPTPQRKNLKKNVTTLGYFLILFDLACSKRSDSGERCEVKKAMKSREGLVFIFSRSFLVRTASHYLNAWNRLSLTRSHWDCWLLIDKMVFPGKPYFVVALWVPDVGKGGVCVGGGPLCNNRCMEAFPARGWQNWLQTLISLWCSPFYN